MSLINRGLRAALVVAILATAACSRITVQQGYLADPTMLLSVAPGVDNRESVGIMLGQPSAKGTFDENTWYYITHRTEQFAFLRPKAKAHQVVAIHFDDKGNVDQVRRYGIEDVVNIDPKNDKTPTLAKDSSILQQLFGNIGRFSGAPAPGGPPQ